MASCRSAPRSISGIPNPASIWRRSPGLRIASGGRSMLGSRTSMTAGTFRSPEYGPADPNTGRRGARGPPGKVFYSNNLACFRNTWSSDPAAYPVYLAIKGGNFSGHAARSPPLPEDVCLHNQADAGSFILDGARPRWIIGLGADDYDLPGYFDHGADNRSGSRWRYYRTQTAGHNTLVIDGGNQIPDAP